MPSAEAIQIAKRAAAEMLPTKPADLDAPGLRLRSGVIYWMPRADIADRGFPTKTVRLWAASPGTQPTPEQWQHIGKTCCRLQREMLAWERTKKLNPKPSEQTAGNAGNGPPPPTDPWAPGVRASDVPSKGKSKDSSAGRKSPAWRDKLINPQELCERRFVELKYAVPGLFPEGVSLLASRPKMGKSWLLLQITTAIASGTVTLVPSDHPPCGDVLYLALEDNARRLQRRLTKYFGARRECWPARLKLATEWRRLDQGGLDDIREWCASVEKPTLVAIDTLKKVRKPKAQNQTDYDADYEACQGLQELAGNISGLSIIVACHDRKMAADDVFDTVSGTLGLTGGVDAIAIMKRAGHGTTLHIEGRDLPEPIEKAVSFDRETCRWMILGEAAEVQRSAERSRVLNALRAAPDGLTTSEIMATAEISTRHNADVLLSKMTEAGEIERLKRGFYGLPGTRTRLAGKAP
jgi:AAA domain/Transcriptional regulator, AbiEi antitoxin